jgi:biopolymer transport protein ExbB
MRSWLLILALVVTAVPAAANAWWQKDWPYRKQITLDASAKGGNITASAGRVPVLVRLHSGNFSFNDSQQSGADLRFVAADDKTPLAFHVESFDPLLGMAAVWVDVPDFPAGSTKDIWLYYGNKKAPPAGDAAQTFDPDYTLIFHFDSPAGAPVKDATAYGSNALAGATGLDQAGIIAKAAKFTGAGPLMVPASTALNVTAGGQFSFSAWVKADAPQARAALYARRDGADSLVVGLDQNIPFVEVGSARIAAPQALGKGQWAHLAVTADGKSVTLYVNGASVGTTSAALPAMATPTAFGGDAAASGGLASFAGEMDEIRLSKTARPAALIQADAMSQGAESKLVVFGKDEKQSGFGFGYFGIIIQSVTVDAWVVISILGVLAVTSWYVMWTKASYVGAVDKANEVFLEAFRQAGGDPLSFKEAAWGRRIAQSSIYRIFRAGQEEMRRRADRAGGTLVMTPEAIEVVRSLMNTAYVRETQRLAKLMVVLTIAISGGPFLGLLGTVVGVMITFAAIAATGDVNVNAIAPGISAALLATVTGLAVAIPALFGYNYIQLRNKDASANMSVFVDEFVTRVSELYSHHNLARAAE